jgi:large subunit ribosomal protein L21
MSKYAIIEINHNQYLVEEGKTYSVPMFKAEVGTLEATVLAANSSDSLVIGTPNLDNVKVTLEVIEHGLGEKVTTRKFVAKSRYRKTSGHRKRVTTFKVASIK